MQKNRLIMMKHYKTIKNYIYNLNYCFNYKIICSGFTSLTKMFAEAATSKGGESPRSRYDFHNLSRSNTTAYEGWALGEEFEGKGLDGTKHKVLHFYVVLIQD